MSAKAAADAFLARTANVIARRTQLLDGNQLSKLAVTLGSRARPDVEAETIPPDGTVIPPGWHLVYFTPSFLESDLGLDGSDKSFNPDPPFTRRMWAGGRMKWHHPPPSLTGLASKDAQSGLRIGQLVTEHTKLFKAEAKQNKQGDSMIIAGVEKQYEGPDGVVLTDQREWVFLPELDPNKQKAANASTVKGKKPGKTFEPTSPIMASIRHKPTPVTLFRFSALTFNGHKIHYSLPWTQDVEGHPDVVVHGPLNVILMLELYRRTHGESKPVKSLDYRMLSPLYANEEYTINLSESGEIWCEKGEEKQLCVTGNIQ